MLILRIIVDPDEQLKSRNTFYIIGGLLNSHVYVCVSCKAYGLYMGVANQSTTTYNIIEIVHHHTYGRSMQSTVFRIWMCNTHIDRKKGGSMNINII